MNNSLSKQILNASGGIFGGVEQNQENETNNNNKRGSIFSLYHVHTNSLLQQKTLTMYQTKTEYSDVNRQKSEVTLGADKRRKLLTQEDQDLKTLNQKKSFKSQDSNQAYDSSTLREHEIDQEDHEKIVIESNEFDDRGEIKSGAILDKQNYMKGSQTSCQLIQLNEESMNHLNDNSQSEISMQGQRRSHNQLVQGLDKNNIVFSRKQQSKNNQSNSQNMNSSISRNNSNMPSPLSKTMDFHPAESNPLFNQLQDIAAQDKNQTLLNSSVKQKQNQENSNLVGEITNQNTDIKNIQNSFQATKSIIKQDTNPNFQHRITQQKSEFFKNVGAGVKTISNFLFVNKVKKKFLSFLSMQKFKNFNSFHFEIVNDVSALEQNTNHSQMSKEDIKLQRLSKEQFDEYKINTFVFQPDSIILSIWNIFVAFILLFLIIVTPVVRSFEAGYDETGLHLIQKYFSSIIFIFDILISFNKAYYDEGMIITNRKKIIKNYCKFKFYFDVFNIICCFLFEEVSIILIYFVSTFRLAQCAKIWDEIDEYLEISQRYQTLAQIFELMILIFLIANLCACGFFYVSKYDHSNGVNVTWISFQKIENADFYTQYIYSIYFEFITMTTIGYGDIYPCSKNEKLYVIFMTLVSVAVFGYSLNAIGEIIREVSQKLSSFKQTKYDISKYLKSRNITKKVQLKIYKYLEYLNRQEIEGHFFMKGEKILNRVSQNLREEVYREYYGKIISQISFFTKNFSKGFLNELSLNMKELNLAPGDYLFKQGSQDCTLFFLSKGVVELSIALQNYKSDKSNEKILHRYKGGDLIGHQEFMTDQERMFSVRSLGISHFVYIRKIDFLAILLKYPLDYEYFAQMKDDLIFKNQDRFQICESCKQAGHNILKCKLLFANYNKLQLVKKQNYSEDHKERIKVLEGPKENYLEYSYFFDRNIFQDIQNKDKCEIVRKNQKKKRWDRVTVKELLKKFRKKFISDAVKLNKRLKNFNDNSGNQDYLCEEINSDNDSQSKLSDLADYSNHAIINTQANLINASLGMNTHIKTSTYQAADSMTFKSYQKTANNSDYSVNESDRIFYKKYPKIKYEDGQYLILSSSQHSSSEVEEEGDDDDEFEDPLAFGDYNDRYRTDDEYIMQDARKQTINEQQLRNQIIKRNTQIRPGTGVLPNIPSPNSRIASVTNMDTSIQINGLVLESPNPTFLNNRILTNQSTNTNSSSMNSVPLSSLSAVYQQQYVQQTSTNQSSSPLNGPIGSNSNINLPTSSSQLPPPTNNNPTQPPTLNINQQILKLNYFDSQDFLEESSQQQTQQQLPPPNNQEFKKLTLILPAVDEVSEINEASSFDMTNSYSNQLSSSPLVRKGQRESSKRHQSRKLSQNTLPRQDSLNTSQEYTLRRKSSRNDSATAKIMRDSLNSKMRKVTYSDTAFRDQLISNFSGSNLQNTLSKSHSRSSRHIPTYQFERSRSRQSQGTFLNNQALFIYTFDTMKEYKYYYPHNNASSIIKQKIKNLKRKKIQRGKKLNFQNTNVGILKSAALNNSIHMNNNNNISNKLRPTSFSVQNQQI
ncbi:cation channel family protein (macronuclear) [Tetrahymena thermophila SB210]|uniref:Cation channel family protein n=1 Tax=Tetrahymena thermophila (strain SB210) TaxID=312017 RepID=Q23R10_TETTS|nr:cation channel family protein [Tetrahymena thermophila SB210]EAR98946.1 cation channel family protein [Tetrahymena thermophila SB210]|eukprot:XP_001019191.1 cation channel family protein [Tetrahymena thermophila SB210]